MTIFNYTLNYVDIGIVAILLVAAILGWRKGIALAVANFVRYSAGMFFCFYISSNFSQVIYEAYLRQKCLDTINQKIVVSNNLDETINNLNQFAGGLPPSVAQNLDLTSINISSTDIAESILTNIFEPFVLAITKIALFIIVFVLFFGATGIILAIVKRHVKKKDRETRSTLRKADKAFGSVFEVIKAAVLVFGIVGVMTYFIDIKEDFVQNSVLLKEATQSTLFNYISDINPFNAITEGLL